MNQAAQYFNLILKFTFHNLTILFRLLSDQHRPTLANHEDHEVSGSRFSAGRSSSLYR